MRTTFMGSAPGPAHYPAPELPEFAFLGRSNVGKSSLLNRLTGSKIARTSKNPGRTQLLNFFKLEAGPLACVLVDLPGYGFAKVPKSVQSGWRELAETYLRERKTLKGAFLLIDSRRGAQEDDLVLCDWMRQHRPEVAVRLIVTKLDKLNKAKVKPALGQIANAAVFSPGEIFGTSALKGSGVEELQEELLTLSSH